MYSSIWRISPTSPRTNGALQAAQRFPGCAVRVAVQQWWPAGPGPWEAIGYGGCTGLILGDTWVYYTHIYIYIYIYIYMYVYMSIISYSPSLHQLRHIYRYNTFMIPYLPWVYYCYTHIIYHYICYHGRSSRLDHE